MLMSKEPLEQAFQPLPPIGPAPFTPAHYAAFLDDMEQRLQNFRSHLVESKSEALNIIENEGPARIALYLSEITRFFERSQAAAVQELHDYRSLTHPWMSQISPVNRALFERSERLLIDRCEALAGALRDLMDLRIRVEEAARADLERRIARAEDEEDVVDAQAALKEAGSRRWSLIKAKHGL